MKSITGTAGTYRFLCIHSTCSIAFDAGLAGLYLVVSPGIASLGKLLQSALMTGFWSPRVWKRPVCCFRNWMKSGPCFATSNSAWKCGSVTDVVSDCELASLR